MINIDFNQPGGFPMSTQILAALQDAYRIFNTLGSLAGELAIIVGCQVTGGGTVTDGFVHINGELLPFKGGAITSDVSIVEIPDQRVFQDGSLKNVIYARYATFGSGTTSYPWANFRRPLTLFQLEDRLLKVEKATPIGLIAIWDRPAEEIPEGWEEHIPLRGNVPVGHNSGDTFFGSLGNTIGASQITLDVNQIPAHNHDSEINSSGDDVDSDGFGSAVVTSNREITGINRQNVIRIKNKGGGQAHSNIQPSRIVKFIRFKGFN